MSNKRKAAGFAVAVMFFVIAYATSTPVQLPEEFVNWADNWMAKNYMGEVD